MFGKSVYDFLWSKFASVGIGKMRRMRWGGHVVSIGQVWNEYKMVV